MVSSRSPSSLPTARGEVAPFEVTLVYFNDVRGEVLPCSCSSGPMGGAPKWASYLGVLRRNAPRPLVTVDAGGALQQADGQARGAWTQEQLRTARRMVHAYNSIQLDSMGLSAADLPPERSILEELVAHARFPILSTNLFDRIDGQAALPGHACFSRGDLKIVALAVTGGAVHSGSQWRLADPVAAVARVVKQVRPTADLVILLSSLGRKDSEELALRVSGIDILVGGSDGKARVHPRRMGETILIANYARGHYGASFTLRRSAGRGLPQYLRRPSEEEELPGDFYANEFTPLSWDIPDEPELKAQLEASADATWGGV